MGAVRADQIAPHNIAAEEAVIGMVLMDAGTLPEIRAIVRPDDFFIQRHQWIYKAMLDIADDPGVPTLDFLTVSANLDAKNKLEEVGGTAALMQLMNRTPSTLGYEAHARIVERLAVRRRLLHAATTIARLAHSETTDIESVIEQAQAAVNAVQDRHSETIIQTQPMEELMLERFQEVEENISNPQRVRFMRTGITPFDMATRGIRPRELGLLAGRPGMGKSAILFQFGQGVARQGNGVLIFSLEMQQKDVLHRMALQLTHLSDDDDKDGKWSDAQKKRYFDAWKQLLALHKKGLLTIHDKPGLTVYQMRSITQQQQRKHKLGLVIVDTINRVNLPAGVKPANLNHQLTLISNQLADWAHDQKSTYAVIAAAQMNRNNTARDSKAPELHQLRDSGTLEQDADWVYGVHRDGYYDADIQNTPQDNRVQLKMLKARNDSGGHVNLGWKGNSFSVAPLKTVPTDELDEVLQMASD